MTHAVEQGFTYYAVDAVDAVDAASWRLMLSHAVIVFATNASSGVGLGIRGFVSDFQGLH
jgi:hypothetical protein